MNESGAPPPSDAFTLTAGADGPILALAANVSGHLKGGVSAMMLQRAFAYWRSVDEALGDTIAGDFQVGAKRRPIAGRPWRSLR